MLLLLRTSGDIVVFVTHIHKARQRCICHHYLVVVVVVDVDVVDDDVVVVANQIVSRHNLPPSALDSPFFCGR